MTLVNTITDTLAEVIDWVGSVVTALINSSGAMNALLPALCIGLSIAVLGFGIRTIKSLVWGI